MADPKYAGLPGIAEGQPDTYETFSDLEMDTVEDETDSEQSETLHLSSLSWLGGDFEVCSKGDETLFQKFTRLRCEVNELTEDLNSMTESARDGESLAGLHKQVSHLQNQLEVCFLQQDDPANSDEVSQSQLLDNLKRILDDISSKDGTGQKSAGRTASYDLYLKTNVQVNEECLALLDRRLTKLEKLLGADRQAKHNVLSVGTDNIPLVAAVEKLESMRAVLHTDHLSHVEGRLAALTSKLNALAAMKDAADIARHNNQVDGLFNGRELRAGVSSVMQLLLQRLIDLKELHESARGWNTRISEINTEQEKTESLLVENKMQIENTQKLLSTSLLGVTTKLEKLQSSITSLPV